MSYMDHAATSPILPEARRAMDRACSQLLGNANSIHTPGHLAHEAIEKARGTVARLINADPSEIIFTSGATEGNNTVMHTFAHSTVYISRFEHPSITESAKHYCDTAKNKKPALISWQLANHEIGTIFPVAKIAEEAHQQGAKIHTDATQAIGKIPVDVKKLNVDYLTFSAHKFGGPTGVGVLYVKTGAPFEPLLYGGHQENGRRAGTYNTIGIIGTGVAAQYILDHDTPKIYEEKIRPLKDELERKILEEIKDSSINRLSGKLCDEPAVVFTCSPKSEEVTSSEDFETEHRQNDDGVRNGLPESLFAELPNILNISFKGAEGESIQLYLDNEGIIVSTGSACAASDGTPSPVLMALHDDAEIAHSSIRFSLGLDTTKQDIDKVMKTLPDIIKKLQGISTV